MAIGRSVGKLFGSKQHEDTSTAASTTREAVHSTAARVPTTSSSARLASFMAPVVAKDSEARQRRGSKDEHYSAIPIPSPRSSFAATSTSSFYATQAAVPANAPPSPPESLIDKLPRPKEKRRATPIDPEFPHVAALFAEVVESIRSQSHEHLDAQATEWLRMAGRDMLKQLEAEFYQLAKSRDEPHLQPAWALSSKRELTIFSPDLPSLLYPYSSALGEALLELFINCGFRTSTLTSGLTLGYPRMWISIV
ncbi:hypothetical protein MNV49_007621 [Pseudohyphozyma bogoriensis]|nr:hypothetical protein MNV49_007621 [Pseudohyphozyma bogoriensis]